MTRVVGTVRQLAAASTAIAVVGVAAPASAAVDDLVLASTSDSGSKGDSSSESPSLSSDGSAVAFYSFATNLDPADTDALGDVYVKDVASGALVLASASDSGVKGNGHSYTPSLSADGTAVAFYSHADNLDPADTDTSPDVYVKDLASGDIALASTADTGVKGSGGSYSPSMAADGNSVAFTSEATNLDPADTDSELDVYVKDLASGDIVLTSTSDTGDKSNGDGYIPFLSADGGRVAFYSLATNLDPADTDVQADVYVKDLASGDMVLASTSGTGDKGNAGSYFPALSADGATVAFHSIATNLDPLDTDSAFDVYVKDLVSGDVVLASTSDTGESSNGYSYSPSLEADGSSVAFVSDATNLTSADTDSTYDVYVKDLTGGDLMLASSSDAAVKSDGSSYNPSLSGDGSTVAFWSFATNLDSADTDSYSDVYVKELAEAAPAVTMTIKNRALEEGDTGRTKFKFRVTLAAASTSTVTVDYATGDLTAVAGIDYAARSGTVTFAPGTTRKKIVVNVYGDTVVEPTEKFTVTLANPSGATISDAEGVGRIRNDDA